MFKEQKTSPYAKMYLVTPAIYEKLKKCIDADDINLVNKKTQEENIDEPKNMADQVIQDIANEEILPQDEPITAINDNSYEPVLETEQNLPGPSSRSHHMFTDSNVVSDNVNIPVNPPIFRNGNYYVNPGDYDVNWSELPFNVPKSKSKDSNIQTDPQLKPKMSNIGVQANQFNPQRHMGIQHVPNNTSKFTQTDINNGAYFVRKPTLTFEKSSCNKDPMLPLSKCKPKFKKNTMNVNLQSDIPSKIIKPTVSFVNDNSIENIRDISNSNIKIKKHICNICQKSFERKWSLTRHYHQVHRNIINSQVNRPTNMSTPLMLTYNNEHSEPNNQEILEPEEEMEAQPIQSRKRQLQTTSYTPIHPKYRQIAESGLKRDTNQAELQDYQEKKFVRRGDRLRTKPKRFDNWGL